MDIDNKEERACLIFSIITSLIMLLGYVIYISASNIFQTHFAKYHALSSYATLTMLGTLISSAIMMLCLLKRLQSLYYQRILISSLAFLLVCIPASSITYPFISGASYSILSLANGWRQLYIPNAIRGTLTGITSTVCGLIDLRSTQIEFESVLDLARYHRILTFLLLLLIVFWAISLRLDQSKITLSQKTLNVESFSQLLVKYPYIFLCCFLGGYNECMFYYAYTVGHEALPYLPIKTFQYIFYAGGVIGPLALGPIADKIGIFPAFIFSTGLLIICKSLDACLDIFHSTSPIFYYINAFIEAGVSSSFLSFALLGEHLSCKGIFRSIAIGTLVLNLGALLCSYFYKLFIHSYAQTKLSMSIVNIVLITLILYLRSKHKQTEDALK